MANHIYKITFIKNKIDSCKIADDTVMDGNCTYQKHNDFLIYALIRAETEEKAQEKASELIGQVATVRK